MSLDILVSQASQPKDVDLVLANFRGLEWIIIPVKIKNQKTKNDSNFFFPSFSLLLQTSYLVLKVSFWISLGS